MAAIDCDHRLVLFSSDVHVNPTTVGFTFLLAILVVSASWGLQYSIFMAVVATLAYNYFFLPPVLRFTIADPQNWVALFVFLVTAIMASQLSERARREALQRNQRRHEVERLYAFSQQLLVAENVFGLLNTIPAATSWNHSAWQGAAVFLENKPKTYFSDIAVQSSLPVEELKAVSGRGEPTRRPASAAFVSCLCGWGCARWAASESPAAICRAKPWRPSAAWSRSPSNAPAPWRSSPRPKPPAKATGCAPCCWTP